MSPTQATMTEQGEASRPRRSVWLARWAVTLVAVAMMAAACGNNGSTVETAVSAEEVGADQEPNDSDSRGGRNRAQGAAIDVHTHVISQPLLDAITGGGVPASTADDLIARLDEAGVERAVVLALGFQGLPDDSNVAPENDFGASIVAQYPDRLIGFCGINPLYDSALSEVDRCLALPEMVGIKLNPVGASNMDWENPDHAAAISAVLDKAQEHDAPVLLHVAAAPLDDDSLVSALTVIATHPEVRFTIAHCGGVADYEIEGYLIAAQTTPPLLSLDNLHTDISACLKFYRDAPKAQREMIVWRLRQWGIERVLFGSDYLSVAPVETPKEALETLDRYPFTRKEIRTILDNDASAWLNGTDQ